MPNFPFQKYTISQQQRYTGRCTKQTTTGMIKTDQISSHGAISIPLGASRLTGLRFLMKRDCRILQRGTNFLLHRATIRDPHSSHSFIEQRLHSEAQHPSNGSLCRQLTSVIIPPCWQAPLNLSSGPIVRIQFDKNVSLAHTKPEHFAWKATLSWRVPEGVPQSAPHSTHSRELVIPRAYTMILITQINELRWGPIVSERSHALSYFIDQLESCSNNATYTGQSRGKKRSASFKWGSIGRIKVSLATVHCTYSKVSLASVRRSSGEVPGHIWQYSPVKTVRVENCGKSRTDYSTRLSVPLFFFARFRQMLWIIYTTSLR